MVTQKPGIACIHTLFIALGSLMFCVHQRPVDVSDTNYQQLTTVERLTESDFTSPYEIASRILIDL